MHSGRRILKNICNSLSLQATDMVLTSNGVEFNQQSKSDMCNMWAVAGRENAEKILILLRSTMTPSSPTVQCIGIATFLLCCSSISPTGVEQCCVGLHLHQTSAEIGRMLASDVRGDTLRLGIQRSSGTWPQTHTQTQAFRNRNLP